MLTQYGKYGTHEANTRKGAEILAKQKPFVAKTSAKLLFVNRLKGKKRQNKFFH
jgi:hypothetical protein